MFNLTIVQLLTVRNWPPGQQRSTVFYWFRPHRRCAIITGATQNDGISTPPTLFISDDDVRCTMFNAL